MKDNINSYTDSRLGEAKDVAYLDGLIHEWIVDYKKLSADDNGEQKDAIAPIATQ